MNAKRTFDEIEDAGATLAQLRELASQFESKYSFVTHITSPDEYERATAMLDELTGGRELGPNEEALLDELSASIATYEDTSEQFKSFNERWGRKLTPVELLKALMESSGLKGHELPEIGDKTVVSKVLNGSRRISHKMAMALGQRFHIAPEAFLEEADSAIHASEVFIDHSLAPRCAYYKDVITIHSVHAERSDYVSRDMAILDVVSNTQNALNEKMLAAAALMRTAHASQIAYQAYALSKKHLLKTKQKS